MSQFKTVFLASRPSFLFLSLSIVLLAAAIAKYDGSEIATSLFIVTLLGAVLSHAAVNLLNEYQDHLSGLDFMTQKTPFSGGSGSLQQTPQAAKNVLNTVRVILGILILIGIYFIYSIGWQLLPLGIVGILLIVFYTSNITKYPWLCLISPGLAFGPVMLLSCYFIFTGEFSILALVLSLIPFFLVNNLLLLNQVPDIDADKKVGRFNILMKIGVMPSMNIFTGFELMAFGVLGFSIEYFQLPKSVWIGALTFVLAVPMIRIVLMNSQEVDKLMPALTMNVIINLLTPILIGLGLWLAIV